MMENYLINSKKNVVQCDSEGMEVHYKKELGYRDFTDNDFRAMLSERDHLRDFLSDEHKENTTLKRALELACEATATKIDACPVEWVDGDCPRVEKPDCLQCWQDHFIKQSREEG